ncbi:efflux RND transporter periplasmic adaptor subunit [Robbsia sp. KACC 23696]|uniref:efflux RND transporter periplasmic adaptor subunit n=1 Tax=Robbsia sp. KACC 23696 TaxID=3149231 RepID=UPI00325A79C5
MSTIFLTQKSLIAVAATLLSTGAFAAGASQDALAPQPSVTTLVVFRAPMPAEVVGYGQVGASEADLTTINLPYAFKLDRLYVQAGQAVRKGAPLLTVTPDPAALLASQQARSAVTFAQKDFASTQSLYDQRLATASQRDMAKKALDDAQQAYAAQQRLGPASGTTTITAAADGVISAVSFAQGDRVAAGAAILQLSANSAPGSGQPNVLLQIEPDDAAKLRLGDRAVITGLSSALLQQKEIGSVTRIGAAIDPITHQVAVGVNATLTGTPYLTGTPVQVRIVAPTDRGGDVHWIVPRNAVQSVDDGATQANGSPASAYLFQIDANHVAHKVPVRIAVESDRQYGVDGALDARRAIITDGSYVVQDGQTVRPTAPAVKNTTGAAQ